MIIGDHIRALKGGRWLHGIDCGDRTVIYFSDRADNGVPGIRRVHFPEFARGAERVQVVNHIERVFPSRMVVARAFSRLRESAFNQMFPDSEQFATWCKNGRLGPGATPDVLVARATKPARARASAVRKAVKAKPARAKARAASVAKRAAPRSGKARQGAAARSPARGRAKAKLGAKAAPAKRAAPGKARIKAVREKTGAKKRR